MSHFLRSLEVPDFGLAFSPAAPSCLSAVMLQTRERRELIAFPSRTAQDILCLLHILRC